MTVVGTPATVGLIRFKVTPLITELVTLLALVAAKPLMVKFASSGGWVCVSCVVPCAGS